MEIYSLKCTDIVRGRSWLRERGNGIRFGDVKEVDELTSANKVELNIDLKWKPISRNYVIDFHCARTHAQKCSIDLLANALVGQNEPAAKLWPTSRTTYRRKTTIKLYPLWLVLETIEDTRLLFVCWLCHVSGPSSISGGFWIAFALHAALLLTVRRVMTVRRFVSLISHRNWCVNVTCLWLKISPRGWHMIVKHTDTCLKSVSSPIHIPCLISLKH